MATQDPKAVFEQHLAAFGAAATAGGDIGDIVKDFTEDAVVFHPGGIARGHSGIHDFLSGFIADLPDGLVEAISIDRLDVEGDYVYLVWHAPGFVSIATDTFVIRNGKIEAQTFTAQTA